MAISSDEGNTGAHRSGVAARLAGLPVETLRVWERRYGVSEPQRSAHGQRLYSDQQVRRLGLIKRLVDQGHAIGLLARLPAERLSDMIESGPGLAAAQGSGPLRPIRLAVVGNALAQRLAGAGRGQLDLEVKVAADDLARAAQVFAQSEVDVLLIDVPELSEAHLPAIDAARAAAGSVATIVLYRFCAAATARRLRAGGHVVARAGADVPELVMLCDAALAGQGVSAGAPVPDKSEAPAPRRFDEQALAALAGAASKVSCECPRHLADILLMLGSFERYSAQCGAVNAADALLHRELNHSAGQARALLETALERLARAEGLPLPAAG